MCAAAAGEQHAAYGFDRVDLGLDLERAAEAGELFVNDGSQAHGDDHGRAREFGERERSRRAACAGRRDHHHRLGDERRQNQRGRAWRVGHHGKVEPPGEQGIEQLLANVLYSKNSSVPQ